MISNTLSILDKIKLTKIQKETKDKFVGINKKLLGITISKDGIYNLT